LLHLKRKKRGKRGAKKRPTKKKEGKRAAGDLFFQERRKE